jgi:formylglycine-generating enzyme required for sulfatase activity
MDPITITTLVATLGPVLWDIFKILLDKGKDLVFDKGFEPFKDMIARGYDKLKDAESLRQVILSTLDEVTDNKDIDRYDKLIATLKLTGLDDKTRFALAGTAVEMVRFSSTFISSELIRSLGLDDSKRELLARFLFALRQNLAKNNKFKDAIAYANVLEQVGLLHGLTEQILAVILRFDRMVSLEEMLILERHLTTDEEQALKDYLNDVRLHWEGLMLPLIRKKSGDVVTSAKLRQVFVPLSLNDTRTEEKIRRNFGRMLREKMEPEREQPIDIGELLNRHERFILIGSPGCGKTTLLNRVALAFSEGRAGDDLNWKGKPLFPLFLRLRNFGAFLKQNKEHFPAPCSGSLIAYLENQFRTGERINLTAQFFDRRLAEGNCLILIDGLDEVSDQRSEVVQHISSFVDQYGTNGNRFGFASRPRGYETVELQLRSLNLAVADVNPLSLDGISQLIQNLLVLIEPEPILRIADFNNLTLAIRTSDDLINIAGTPLFCSALVQVYKYHGATLPQRRVDVFDEIVDLLLGFWRAQQRHLSESEKLAIEDGTGKQFREVKDAVAVKQRRLSYLALIMQQNGKAEIEKSEAVAILTEHLQQRERVPDHDTAVAWAENFLENSHERSGLLVERDPGVYAFLHKGFMEYLAASALVNQSKTLIETILEHVNDEWWEQVILLTGAHPKLAEDFRIELIEKILNKAYQYPIDSDENIQHLVTAGQLTRDMAEYLPGPQHEQVEEVLHKAAINPELLPIHRAKAADVLDEIGWYPIDLPCFVPVSETSSTGFWIGKYPVTNLQYKRFLDDPEFASERFWDKIPVFDENLNPIGNMLNARQRWLLGTPEDKKLFSNDGKIYPRSWDNPGFGIARKCAPVVSISWIEANAYCKWLKEHWHELDEGRTNPELSPSLIRLPTEAEWLVAAGGGKPEGRFPWDTPCQATSVVREILQSANVSESNIRRTTPVGMYPLGESKFGVCDLAGNIWEWQANKNNKDQDELASLRGGSWSSGSNLANVTVRYNHYFLGWDISIGFRVIAIPVNYSKKKV